MAGTASNYLTSVTCAIGYY